MNLVVHPSVVKEAEEAAAYYAERSPDIAEAFVGALERCMRLVFESPNTWPRVSDSVRRCQIDGFPHWIVYQVGGDSLRILALVHPKRRPGYWRERL